MENSKNGMSEDESPIRRFGVNGSMVPSIRGKKNLVGSKRVDLKHKIRRPVIYVMCVWGLVVHMRGKKKKTCHCFPLL